MRKRSIVMMLSFHAPLALRRSENSATDNFLRTTVQLAPTAKRPLPRLCLPGRLAMQAVPQVVHTSEEFQGTCRREVPYVQPMARARR